MFASGFVAEIGVNAYAVWSALKIFADYNTGQAFPGMRTIGERIGLSAMTVKRAIDVLKAARMVRVVKSATRRKGQTYVARERLAVRLGSRVICTIVVDYVPARLRGQINRIEQALKTGEHDAEAFAEVEIIPGEGFVWDESSKTLRGAVKASEMPSTLPSEDEHHQMIGEAVLSRMAPNMSKRLKGGRE